MNLISLFFITLCIFKITLFLPKKSLALPGEISEYPHKIETIDDLTLALIHGLELSYCDFQQVKAFNLYRRNSFGDSTFPIDDETINYLLREQFKKHPTLTKMKFRDFDLQIFKWIIPDSLCQSESVTSETRSLSEQQIRADQNILEEILSITSKARKKRWEKLLQVSDLNQWLKDHLEKGDSILQGGADLSRVESQGPNPNPALQNPALQLQGDKEEFSFSVARILTKRLQELREEAPPALAQTIIDLVQLNGFLNLEIKKKIQSKDQFEILNGLDEALRRRDLFSALLLRSIHEEGASTDEHPYEALIKYLNPLPEIKIRRLEEKRMEFEHLLQRRELFEKKRIHQLTIRHLSLTESPFRSCLGLDCSSNTYLTAALDPNYHYFTLTNHQGFSSGQITIVLGEALSDKGISVPCAFVDKIQNIPQNQLPIMLEGIRQSVAEKDYILVFPTDLGDQNGISNEAPLRELISSTIPLNSRETMTAFHPHPHSVAYEFDYGTSRADLGLSVQAVRPLCRTEQIELSPKKMTAPWKIKSSSDIHMDRILAAILQLKNGDEREKVSYCTFLQLVQTVDARAKEEMTETLRSWLTSDFSFKVRKQAILSLWEVGFPLGSLMIQLKRDQTPLLHDQTSVLDYVLKTPRYLEKIRSELIDPLKEGSLDSSSIALLLSLLDSKYQKTAHEFIQKVFIESGDDVPELLKSAEPRLIPYVELVLRSRTL